MDPKALKDWLGQENVGGTVSTEALDSFGNANVLAGVAWGRRDKESHVRTEEFYAVTDNHLLHGQGIYHLSDNNEQTTSIEVSCGSFALSCVSKVERRAEYRFQHGQSYRARLEISIVFTAASGLGQLEFPQPNDERERRLHLSFCKFLSEKLTASVV